MLLIILMWIYVPYKGGDVLDDQSKLSWITLSIAENIISNWIVINIQWHVSYREYIIAQVHLTRV